MSKESHYKELFVGCQHSWVWAQANKINYWPVCLRGKKQMYSKQSIIIGGLTLRPVLTLNCVLEVSRMWRRPFRELPVVSFSTSPPSELSHILMFQHCLPRATGELVLMNRICSFDFLVFCNNKAQYRIALECFCSEWTLGKSSETS